MWVYYNRSTLFVCRFLQSVSFSSSSFTQSGKVNVNFFYHCCFQICNFFRFLLHATVIYCSYYPTLFSLGFFLLITYFFFNFFFLPLFCKFFWQVNFYFFYFFYFFSILGVTIGRVYFGLRGLFVVSCIPLICLIFFLIFSFEDLFFFNKTYSVVLFSWAGYSGTFSWKLCFSFDFLAYVFILLVAVIGLATTINALNYFRGEANEEGFLLLIHWFILSMMLLVISNNFLTLFLGWEMIGLTSFLLINFWAPRVGTLKSAFKAFTFNKVSDLFLLLFVVIVYSTANSMQFDSINLYFMNEATTPHIILKIGVLFLICCSSIKSAQIFGHLWLPDSMEAPLPASALIHSATLVSAGVYLLLRFQIIVQFVGFSWVVILLGSLTACFGGVVAAMQTDVKRLLAYSTISHCGFLFVCVGLNNVYLVLGYLFLHGLFKAGTFFTVGPFIRRAGSQDLRAMGSLSKEMPLNGLLLGLLSFGLGGFPFTFGFLYKQLFVTWGVLLISDSFFLFFICGLWFVGLLTSFIYIFKLNVYCLFYRPSVVEKTFYTSVEMVDVLPKTQSLKYGWSETNYNHLVSCLLLLFFSGLVNYFIWLLSVVYSLPTDLFPLYISTSINFVSEESPLLLQYTNFFYFCYLTVVLWTVFYMWRYIVFWVDRFFLALFFSFVLFFFSTYLGFDIKELFLLYSWENSFWVDWGFNWLDYAF